MTQRRTTSSTPRLSELARYAVPAEGAVATAWPSVRDKARDLGITFDPWQDAAGRLILAKRKNGRYAATVGGVGMSIPRQVGKTFLVGGIVFALGLLNPGLTIIWTAHRLRTADETFEKMQSMSKRRKVAPFMLRPKLGSGEQEIRFKNGSRILFGARERGFGRGFDEVDVLIFDEAQILTEAAIDDMVPATLQSRQPTGALLLFIGTPPKPTDPGEVFSRMRSDALSGEDPDASYVEFSADPKFKPAEKPAPMTPEDWRQIAKANPSHPHRTPRDAIMRMRKFLSPESMLREGYGIWDDLTHLPPFPGWGSPDLVRVGPDDDVPPTALALDMNHEREPSLAAAWRGEGDVVHLELVPVTGADDAELSEQIVKMAGRRIPVVIDSMSPAASLIPALKEAKVKVVSGTSGDMGKACGGMAGAIKAKRVTHAGQAELNKAIVGSKKRNIGTAGAWGIDRRDPESNIAPAVAAALAYYGATTAKKPTGRAVFA